MAENGQSNGVALESQRQNGIPLTGSAVYDQDLYGDGNKYAGYNEVLGMEEEEEEDVLQQRGRQVAGGLRTYFCSVSTEPWPSRACRVLLGTLVVFPRFYSVSWRLFALLIHILVHRARPVRKPAFCSEVSVMAVRTGKPAPSRPPDT